MQFSPRDVFTPLSPDDKATMLIELFSNGIHRVPLVNGDNTLAGLVTQVDVAMELLPILKAGSAHEMGHASLLSLGVALHSPVFCNAVQEVGDTLAQLDAWQIQAVAVCDDSGKLVANFSVSNLAQLWSDRDNAESALGMSVLAYLQKHAPKSLAPLTCSRATTLVDALGLMIDKQVHRLWIVDDKGHPTGVFTFSDLCRLVRDHVDSAYVSKNAPAASASAAPAKPHSAYGVIFRTAQGQAVSLDDAGEHLVLRASATDEHSIIEIEHLANSAVALRAANNKYVALDPSHHVKLIDKINETAHWNIVHVDSGYVALRSSNNGEFLEPYPDQRLHSSWFHATNKAHLGRPSKKQLFRMTNAIAPKKSPIASD
jgi:CBS domain-containing protein